MHQASDMDATVNKEVGNYMKQMFKTYENVYKTFYQIIFLEICKSCKIVPKCLYVKKDCSIRNPSTKCCYKWRQEKLHYQLRLCNVLVQQNVRKLFKLQDDFGQVVKKLK